MNTNREHDTVASTNGHESITLQDDRLRIRNWESSDPETVRLFTEAREQEKDLSRELRLVVRLGALGLRRMGSDVEVQHVEKLMDRNFDQMLRVMDEKSEKRLRDQERADEERLRRTERFLVEAKKGTEQLQVRVQEALKSSMKETSADVKDTVQGKLKEHTSDQRRLLNPKDADSPLHGSLSDIEQEISKLAQAIRSIDSDLRARKAARTERDKGTEKGREYEDNVHVILAETASVFGDDAVFTGDTTEDGRRKAGDTVVSLNPEDTGGVTVQLVFDACNGRLRPAEARKKLDKAIDLRGATAGALVFGCPDHFPSGAAPLHQLDRGRFYALCSEEDWEPTILQAAYRLLRITALESLREQTEVDAVGVQEDVDQVRALLGSFSSLKGKITILKDGVVDQAEKVNGSLETLKGQIESALDRVETRLQPVSGEGERESHEQKPIL